MVPRRAISLVKLLVAIAIIVVLIGLFGGPISEPISESILFGWMRFPSRVFPAMRPALDQVAVFFIGVVVIVALLRRTGLVPSVWANVRVVGLILLVFVAGLTFVGLTFQTGRLMSDRRPWILSRFGSGSMREIGHGVHGYLQGDGKLVPGWHGSPQGEPLHGWPTLLLPFIEQDRVVKQIDLTRPWDDPANRVATETVIRTYQHPDFRDEKIDGRPAMFLAGNVNVLGERPRKFTDFAVGWGNTILMGDITDGARPWAHPMHLRDPALGLGHPQGFGSPSGRQSVQVLMLDGSVRTFNSKDKDDADEFRQLGRGSP